MTRLRGLAVRGAVLWIFVGCSAPARRIDVLADAGPAPDATTTGVSRPPTVSPCVSDWPQGPGGWERICAEAPGTHFLSVWGSSPDDVYLAGGRPGRTVIWHFDGARLAPLEVEGDQRAWWVFGLDRDHVFVSGEGGLLMVREGGGAFRRLDTRTTRTIYGLWARDPDEVFFVTGDFAAGARGLVHRWTPVGTSTLSAPALDAFTGAAFFKVWGAGAKLWVVGEQGTVIHFDGRAWSRLDAPETFSPLLTVSGRNADDVFAVGGRGRGLLARSAGSAFRALALPPDTPGIMGVHTATGVPALISGENGLLASVVEDEVRSEGRYTDEPLHAVWQDSIGGAWAVGGNFFAVNREPFGVILRRPSQLCPLDAIARPGYHHLDLQGRGGARRADGTYPMFDMPRGRIAPELQHGEHFLLGPGARVEFTAPLCADIGPEVLFRLPNNDVVGSVALHQLFVVRGGAEHLVAEAIDDVPGNFGYIPFDRSSLPADELLAISEVTTDLEGAELGWSEVVTSTAFPSPPRDLLAGPGDTLLFRATNIGTKIYGLMIWYPQRGLQYQSFIEVRVPVSPGGELPDRPPPPPRPGPCAPVSSARYLAVDSERSGRVLLGPQGSLMLSLTAIGSGFEPGDASDALHPGNPAVFASLSLDRPVDLGGRLVADGLWRRGLTREGDHLLLELLPSVPPDAIAREALLGSNVHASLTLVDAGGVTLCAEGTFSPHD